MAKLDYNAIKWGDYFIYDTTSPTCLRRKVDVFAGKKKQIKCASAGDIAGAVRTSSKDGYSFQSVSFECSAYKVSRIIWCIHHGSVGNDMVIDHINGDSTDNRIENLREVGLSENRRNSRLDSRNTSGITGVRVVNSRGCLYSSARWYDMNGTLREKWFSVRKLGLEKAIEMATKVREEMIEKLNTEGAGYTVRHGF